MSDILTEFRKFVDLIEGRAMACDGPVTPFLEELHVASEAEKERFTAILAKIYQSRSATEDQVKHIVSRFLGWKLLENFNPDGGVNFKKMFNEHTDFAMKHEPSGTNLLDGQAEAMIRYLLDGLPFPETHKRASQAADAYVAEQGIEHSGGIIERAFEDGATWASSQISDEAIGTIWTAAMTAAVNIIVKRQNDLNDDDGPLEVLNEQGDCINALKKWMHVDNVFLEELRHMLGARSEPCDCCEGIRRAESDLAGPDDDHQERVDQVSVMGADWAEPNYGNPHTPSPQTQMRGPE